MAVEGALDHELHPTFNDERAAPLKRWKITLDRVLQYFRRLLSLTEMMTKTHGDRCPLSTALRLIPSTVCL
jgi:hypothetical protein